MAEQAAPALAALSMPADDWYVGINGVSAGPMRLSELRSKASAGAVGPDSLVWRDGFDDWQPLRSFPELLAVIEDVLLPSPAAPVPALITAASPVHAVGTVTDPFSPAPSAPVVMEEEIAGLSRSGPSSIAVVLAIVAALGLGLTVGFVFFGNASTPEPVVKYVEVPARAGNSGDGPARDPANAAVDTSDSPNLAQGPNVARAGGRGSAAGNTTAPSAAPLAGLKGLDSLKGPSGLVAAGPASDSPAGGSGQPLDSGQVQRTVSRYTASVKRSCWQPALDSRTADAPSSARVVVSIQVAPSGTVQNVSTSGDPKGYSGLAPCIASRVRGWQFPVSSGTTTVNVPFVFAAQ